MQKSLSIILSLGLFFSGCTERTFNTSETQSETKSGFAADVSGKRHCSKPNFLYVDSGDKPTTVYHWTNDKKAITNPKEYLEARVREGNKQNDTGDFGKSVLGNGLYVAMDPFQSAAYGLYLIQFEIRPHSKFPKETHKDVETGPMFFRAQCPGVHYPFTLAFNFLKTDQYKDGPALVLWDLAAVDPKSLRSFQPGTELTNEAFDPVLNNAMIKFGWQTTVSSLLTGRQAKEALLAQTLTACYTKKLDFAKGIAPTEFKALGRTGVHSIAYFSAPHTCIGDNDGTLWETCAGSLGLRTGLQSCMEQYEEAQKWHPADIETMLKQQKEFWQKQVDFWSKQYSLENWTELK